MNNNAKIEDLLNQTVTAIQGGGLGNDVIIFVLADGRKLQMFHEQDCCESVTVEDVCGDLKDLIGSPVLQAECSTSRTPPPGKEIIDSDTWTFYRIATVKGAVTIRWWGSSNGYYSESVDLKWA